MNSGNSALLIDAGTGNLHSVYHALVSLGFDIRVTSDPDDLAQVGRVILPGVGAFGHFMEGLHDHHLAEPLVQIAQQGKPFLGICVGMQALFASSSEAGEHQGLGLIPGMVMRFPEIAGYKVPHTGWNQLWPVDKNLPSLVEGLKPGDYAYFNHSYYCLPFREDDIAVRTDYGIGFTSMVWSGNLWGVQFHPEKSQRTGLQILHNFMSL